MQFAKKVLVICKQLFKINDFNLNFFDPEYKNFCIIKCKKIKTYFVENCVFSLFSFPLEIELNYFQSLKSKFIVLNEKKIFVLRNDLYENLDLKEEAERTTLNVFINEFNQLANNEKIYLKFVVSGSEI